MVAAMFNMRGPENPWWRHITGNDVRDIILFLGGLGGVWHETVVHTSAERPTLLLLFAAMMGLPAFLRGGDKKNTDEGEDG